MSLFWQKLIEDVSRTMESRCNNIRAECGLNMCEGDEFCPAEICAPQCPMKPFKIDTIKKADEMYKNFSPVEVGK